LVSPLKKQAKGKTAQQSGESLILSATPERCRNNSMPIAGGMISGLNDLP